MTDSVVSFGPLRLLYDASDRSGEGYRTRDWYEEFISPIYADIDRLLEPKWIVDVGSNYGLTCLFARHRFPGAKIIAAEPAAHLVRYIRRNMEANGVANIEINHAIVGDQVRDSAAFHFHPASTQDSRVVSPGKAWLEEQTRETTLDVLASGIGDRDGVYIKIDTQG